MRATRWALTGWFVFAALALSARESQRPAASAGQTPSAPVQSTMPATGFLMGRVLDAATNRPIPDAQVSLTAAPTIARELNVSGLTGVASRRILTDGEGRFVFRELPAGSYLIAASAADYLAGQYGQRRPQSAAQALTLGTDQKFGDVDVRLWKGATLGGTVTNEAGEPVIGMRVNLFRLSRTTGRWQQTVYSSGQTDDRGVYRISGNLPGQFYVMVQTAIASLSESTLAGMTGGQLQAELPPALRSQLGLPVLPAGDVFLQIAGLSQLLPPIVRADGSIVAYPSTFYPNAISAGRALPVTVGIGEERTGVDIQMRALAMARVSGVLMGPTGPQPNFSLRLISSDVDAVGGGEGVFQTAQTLSDAAGRFVFPAVPPGSYSLKADAGAGTGAIVTITGGVSVAPAVAGAANTQVQRSSLWAEVPVSVGETPINDLTLQLREGASIRGRVIFEGTREPPTANELGSFTVGFASADGRARSCCAAVRIEPDGTFRTPGYMPGAYYPAISNGPRWNLKSVTANGHDILGAPLKVGDDPISDVVVTFTDETSNITGRVVDRSGAIDGIAAVVIFPVTTLEFSGGVNTRVVRLARPSPQTGLFSFPNVLPGDYFIGAAADDSLPNWQDPAVLKAVAAFATRITIQPGNAKDVQLVRGDVP